MRSPLLLLIAFITLSTAAAAQPRPVDRSSPVSGPATFEARYEGGLFGASKKQTGSLTFDDANERLIFTREGKEMFAIPYKALIMVYPDSKDSVPQGAKVISHLPLPGAGLANLFSKSTKYANMTFEDPDLQANGTASFRFKEKDKLMSFINQLGSKAKMTQRGDAFYKPRNQNTY